MFAWGPGWTGVNRMQLQPRVQPLEPDRDLGGSGSVGSDWRVCGRIQQTLYNRLRSKRDLFGNCRQQGSMESDALLEGLLRRSAPVRVPRLLYSLLYVAGRRLINQRLYAWWSADATLAADPLLSGSGVWKLGGHAVSGDLPCSEAASN
jgi:hypothetical protein